MLVRLTESTSRIWEVSWVPTPATDCIQWFHVQPIPYHSSMIVPPVCPRLIEHPRYKDGRHRTKANKCSSGLSRLSRALCYSPCVYSTIMCTWHRRSVRYIYMLGRCYLLLTRPETALLDKNKLSPRNKRAVILTALVSRNCASHPHTCRVPKTGDSQREFLLTTLLPTK